MEFQYSVRYCMYCNVLQFIVMYSNVCNVLQCDAMYWIVFIKTHCNIDSDVLQFIVMRYTTIRNKLQYTNNILEFTVAIMNV